MNTKFTKATDTQHQIKLESSLISAMWRTGAAIAGEKVSFEVLTAFVGNGADIKITGKSDKGKKLGKIKGEIKNNKYIGELEIPADTQLGDFVYFEVDLPQNGLNGQSNKIQVYPPIEITNMKWSAKEAREGDLLTLSADIKGAEEGTDLMVLIYEYDKDAIHDRIAQLPTTVKSKKMEISWEYQYIDRTGDIPTDGEMKKYNKNYAHP
ncbi:MAG: hypothetical protein NTV06_10355, partial [candidate division Zixibacteria bacterium]|nr:hypothetical protein [candidate division Zixibacteria bacterium]